ncbi:hypothetical protein N9N16_02745 [Porticoccaceae bacterium]|nr:hypothetical protein [Porticoccaceae bacterium]
MRLILVVVALIASVFAHSTSFDNLIVKDNRVANDVVIRLISSGVISDTPANNNNTELAQKICLAGGRTSRECMGSAWKKGPKTVAQGICFAGGVDEAQCMGSAWKKGPKTVAQGICFAGGVDEAQCMGSAWKKGPKTVAQGICFAGGLDEAQCMGSAWKKGPKTTQEALQLVTNASGASDILEDPSATSSPTRVINAGKNTYVTNGRTTTGSDGSIYSTNRSRTVTIGSDGSIYTTTGVVTIGSNGQILVTSGNTITDFSGLTCVDIGASINCN